MAGIYIHIPFCKQACHYCNFHFSTSLNLKEHLLQALVKELQLQKDYLNNQPIQTIYLGGGTPSLLNAKELNQLFDQINQIHPVSSDAEITLEANPDDLTTAKFQELQLTPVNRLSIGIQSFHDQDLQFMNRAHNAKEALRCIHVARDFGFDDLTIDLIYGTPTMDFQGWQENLEKAIQQKISHLSCYCLTVEPKTALDHFVQKGTAPAVDEEKASAQFEYLMQRTQSAGYEHYEISNFALPGHYAQHNSSYWKATPYLGIGPSAHSFNGHSRQWNISDNPKYIKAIQAEVTWYEVEILTPEEQYNEYVMTGLRTKWGCSLEKILPEYHPHFLKKMEPMIQSKWVTFLNNTYVLTNKGKLLADKIAMELFI